MLLCAKLLMAWTPAENANVGFFGKLIIFLGVLIFAKGFPKWISNMVGLDGEAGLGGLGLKKKLAGAALVGGAIQKASDSATKFASQGQQRTLVLSLKLSELEIIREKTGFSPILLLDDVLAELDEVRQNYLLKSIEKDTQTIITSVDTILFEDEFLKDVIIYKVDGGKIV